MTKTVLERALEEELTEHLGYEKHDPGGRGSGNSRNGVLDLAVRHLDEFRRPNVGTRSSGWKQVLQAFTIHFEGRIPTPRPPRSRTQTV